MMNFLFSLPLWALGLVLNVWLMGFALTSLWAFRRWMLPRLHIDTNAALFYGAAAMQSAMVLYGLVAALTAAVYGRSTRRCRVAGLSGFLAMVLFVIISLDRPFHGAMAIPADSYQLIYGQLMKR